MPAPFVLSEVFKRYFLFLFPMLEMLFMADAFATRTRKPSDPAMTVFEVIPDDDNDLARVTLALKVATPGKLRVRTQDGAISDILIQPGYAFPLRVRRVWETGTTATGVRALA